MLSTTIVATNAPTFFRALGTLSDPRDNRGKRHNLAFVVGAVALAVMAGRTQASSIHRYIQNKLEWLREMSQMPDAQLISRAHLPRLLAVIERKELNQIVEAHFGMQRELNASGEWVALDGKTLRGTTRASDKQGERTLWAVTHTTRTVLAQREMRGPKSSEVVAVRELLQETGLEKARVTLDALHCNPITTAQVHQAGGIYLTQVKDNQSALATQCQQVAAQAEPLGTHTTTDQGHGRIETRRATLFALAEVPFEERWVQSGLQALIVMERKTRDITKGKTTQETSYYVTNEKVENGQPVEQTALVQAVREHWSAESDNWIRDVTFEEDQTKTKNGDQAQAMAGLRTLAMRLFRKANIQNFQAAIETFVDCPDKFEAMLRRVGFL
jgi:predicted transposase YbfD/YdcC